jgi:hypothetical protein
MILSATITCRWVQGSWVPHNEQGLTEREYYVLGCLAEPLRRGVTGVQRYTAEAERLVQRGYLERAVIGTSVGKPYPYIITPKGWAAWQAYRFTGP